MAQTATPSVVAEGLTCLPVTYAGEAPQIRAHGLKASERVRIHALQRWSRWQQDSSGQWGRVAVILHAWAEFAADAAGEVALDTSKPLAGTFASVDPLGLVWSAIPRGDARLPADVPSAVAKHDPREEGRVELFLERGGEVAGMAGFVVRNAPDGIRAIRVEQLGLVGVLAAAADAKRMPAVVILHGSEGGDFETCEASATAYAAKGFTALALIWYSPTWKGVRGVPTDGIRVDVEVVERARSFLASRPEADGDRIGLVGTSKGAELATLAATIYPWVRAVVGIVPTDVVWEGFGRVPEPGEAASTWSHVGKPLPYVPLIPFDPDKPGVWKSNTQRYSTSRDQAGATVVEAARIPIEKAGASFLLLAAERDEVWASGKMSLALQEQMRKAKLTDRIEVEVYPGAGHQIAGTGVFPVWLYASPEDNRDGLLEGRDVVATGEAVGKAWKRTIDFLREHL
jgi:dienelactone hydrolase